MLAYTIPAIHLFTAYREMGYREGQFPNAERIGRETVTLPLFPAMELSDVDRVVEAVNEVIAGARDLNATVSVVIPCLQRGAGAGEPVCSSVPGVGCAGPDV